MIIIDEGIYLNLDIKLLNFTYLVNVIHANETFYWFD